jgi:hypothetical protein
MTPLEDNIWLVINDKVKGVGDDENIKTCNDAVREWPGSFSAGKTFYSR